MTPRLLRELIGQLRTDGTGLVERVRSRMRSDHFRRRRVHEEPRDEEAASSWNDGAIVAEYAERWPSFLEQLSTTAPLTWAPERKARNIDRASFAPFELFRHNTNVSLLYAVARASRQRRRVSVFDWGGCLGYLAPFVRALLPDLELEYHCRDLGRTVARAERLVDRARFYVDDRWLERTYDLVVASNSLQYARRWREQLGRLASAAEGGFVYLTIVPISLEAPTFAIEQSWRYPDGSKYREVEWCIKREDLLACASGCRLVLEREFVNGWRSPLDGSDSVEYRGYLFHRAAVASA